MSKTFMVAFKLNAMLSRNYKKTFDKAEDKATQLANSLDFAAKRAMRLTAPLKAIAATSIKAAQDWESAWTSVRKVTDGSEEDLQALEYTALRMARELPHTHKAIASVFEAGSRLGIATGHLEGFSRTMLAVEATTTLTLDKAATGFANISNVMGTSQADFDRMGSTILKLGNNFNSTEADILKMSSRMAGAASAIGMTEASLMGFATATSAVGIEAAVGATAWNTILSDMDIAVATGSDSLEAFARVAGKSAEEFSAAFRQDATGAITSFIGGLNRIDGEGGNVALTLYNMGYRADGVRGTLVNLAGGYDVLVDALQMGNKAWYENTELTKAVEERYATFESQLQIMRNQLNHVGIVIGTVLMPHVLRFIGVASSFAEWFSELDSRIHIVIASLIGLAVVLGPFLWILSKVIKVGKGLYGVWIAFTTANIKFTAVTSSSTIAIGKKKIALGALGKGIAGYNALLTKGIFSLTGYGMAMKKSAAGAGLLTKALVFVKIGFIKLTAAMLLNPIGLIIAGVVALTAGIVGLVRWLNRTGKEYKALGEETQQLLERQQSLSEAVASQGEDFERNTRLMQMAQTQTDNLSDSVKHLSDMQAANVTERERLGRQALELELELGDVYARRAEIEEQLNDGTRRNRSNRRALENAINDLITVEDGYRLALEANAEQMKFVNSLYDDNVQALADISQAQQNAAIDTYGHEMTMRRLAFTSEEWADAQGSALDRMNSAFEGYKRITTNVFDTVNQRAYVSVGEMTANLTANADAVEEWSKNMAILHARFDELEIDEALLEQLRNAGPEMSETIAKLVDACDYALQDLGAAFERSTEVAVEAMQRELDPMGVANSAEELIDHVALAILENQAMENSLIDKVNAGFGVFAETIYAAGFNDEGTNIAYSIGEGIRDGSIHVESAMVFISRNAMESVRREFDMHSPSRKMIGMGKHIMDGMSIGIINMSGKLIRACEDIAEDVSDSLTVSPPAVEIPAYSDKIAGYIWPGGYAKAQSATADNATSSLTNFSRYENLTATGTDNPSPISYRPVDVMSRLDEANASYGGDSMSFSYSPVITINGGGHNGNELESAISSALKNGYSEVENIVKRVFCEEQSRKRRLANA